WNLGYMTWYKLLGISKEMEESFLAFQHLWRLSDHHVIIMSGYEQVDQKSGECVVVSYIYQPRDERSLPFQISTNPVGPWVQIHHNFKKRGIEDHQPGL